MEGNNLLPEAQRAPSPSNHYEKLAQLVLIDLKKILIGKPTVLTNS
jgi:hypothetical protein